MTTTQRCPTPYDLIQTSYQMCDGLKRYRLSNGWFIDFAKVKAHNCYGYPVTLWQPGAGPTGIAAFRGGGKSLRDVLALLGD
ncbi:MAG: hypothetical protein JWQ87_5479 [Candidatus Sulfotelmatobacter sp.]|nr:hypothetical protein [Candidatus Sulfotelmatobacter sp.]